MSGRILNLRLLACLAMVAMLLSVSFPIVAQLVDRLQGEASRFEVCTAKGVMLLSGDRDRQDDDHAVRVPACPYCTAHAPVLLPPREWVPLFAPIILHHMPPAASRHRIVQRQPWALAHARAPPTFY
ncbi:MAG: DUF2946 domain-containing protein [Zoogloeaceae bacterium]|nr:DUF2946 domain-containing protein [Zoogloeaceae bacterium]